MQAQRARPLTRMKTITPTLLYRVGVVLGGAKSRTRTGDPRIFSAMLYQLSYLGTSLGIVNEWWAMTGSNRRLPRCKRGALPLS